MVARKNLILSYVRSLVFQTFTSQKAVEIENTCRLQLNSNSKSYVRISAALLYLTD